MHLVMSRDLYPTAYAVRGQWSRTIVLSGIQDCRGYDIVITFKLIMSLSCRVPIGLKNVEQGLCS